MSVTRRDSWAAKLLPDEAAACYERWTRNRIKWNDMADWMVETYGVDQPSRSSFYEFFAPPDPKADYRGGPAFRMYMEVRNQSIRAAGQQMADWAKSLEITDDQLVNGLKALGCDAVSNGNQEAGIELLGECRKQVETILKHKELGIKQKSQETKDEQLRLAREKFEFDAAKKAMDEAAKIKTVAADDALSTDEKIAKVREVLFG